MTLHTSQPARALIAGAISLSILSGMIVLHAWPLWFGRTALLPVTPIDPRDPFRGEYVQLNTPATNLFIQTGDRGPGAGDRGPATQPGAAVAVTPVGDWWNKFPAMPDGERHRAVYGMTIYVQLEPDGSSGEYRAVSVSDSPVPGRSQPARASRFVVRSEQPPRQLRARRLLHAGGDSKARRGGVEERAQGPDGDRGRRHRPCPHPPGARRRRGRPLKRAA